MDRHDEYPHEIAIVGDLTDHEAEITAKMLEVPFGGSCVLYFDSPGGSPYSGIAMMSLIMLRDLKATAVVTGECSSAALWPFAACQRRIVTPYSVMLFHPLKWQSDENVGLAEAAEWARHFGQLETEMDQVLARLLGVSTAAMGRWMQPGRYVSGRELAETGLAEMVDLHALKLTPDNNGARRPRKPARARAAT